MRLHREARPTLLYALLLADGLGAVIIVGGVMTELPLLIGAGVAANLVLSVLLVRFFRDPPRHISWQPGQVLAPCDGRVVAIETVNDQRHFHGPRLQVSIFMSPLNVHVCRLPTTGTVVRAEHRAGRFLAAFNPKSSELNEHTYVVIKTDGPEVACKQIAGAVARRISCYVQQGQSVTAGAELGFIKFSSRMDVLLPPGTPVQVQVGDRTVGGVTLLSRLG